MTNKIIDCFMFYNELKMLKFRLDYLYNIVDKFILVECTLTHSGNTKELYYNNNKHLFEKYNDKIIHIIVEDLPTRANAENAWVRENMHRACIERGLMQIDLDDNDILCICDLDEISDRKTLKIIKNMPNLENIAYALEQDNYRYNINYISDKKWYHTKIINYYTYKNIFNKDLNVIRLLHYSGRPYKIIKNGGWHFSYFGDVKFIKNKLLNFSHQEFNTEKYINDDRILKYMKEGKDLHDDNITYNYIDVKDNQYLPENFEDLFICF